MNDQSAAKPRGGVLTWALWGAAAIGVAAVVYITVQSTAKPPTKTDVATSAPVATAPPTHDVAKKLEHPADGKAPPAYVFFDGGGNKVTPADFKGKVVVLNIWATWCAPCKLEMPTLAKLATAYAGQPVAVSKTVSGQVDASTDTKVRGFGGDWDALKFGYALDIFTKKIEYGDPFGNGDLQRRNSVAYLTEVIFGWAIMDTTAFVAYEDVTP